MSAELLTEEELDDVRCANTSDNPCGWLGCPADTCSVARRGRAQAKLLRAYESLVQQVETLTLEKAAALHGAVVALDKHVTAEAEVARLREEMAVRTQRCDAWASELDAERAAHEQTKAELDRYAKALGAAEARITELEHEVSGFRAANEGLLTRAASAETALASARELIQTAMRSAGNNPHWKGWEPFRAWLAANPKEGT